MYQSLTQLSIYQIILLMMFGCKYVSQIMELLGSEVAKEKGIQGLLDKLHDMELVLPD